MDILSLVLPWPPSVNHYFGQRGVRKFVTAEGLFFRGEVRRAFMISKHQGFGMSKLSMNIIAYPPDRRRRDLDNIIKITQDSLQKAGAFVDDNQIDHLSIARSTNDGFRGYIEVLICAC